MAESEEIKAFDQKLILGQIVSVDEDNGKIQVDFLTIQGSHIFNMPSPFFSLSSWLRAYPEEGALVLIAKTSVNQEPRIIQVFDQSEQTRLLLNTVQSVGDSKNPQSVPAPDSVGKATAPPQGLPMRKLKKGEIEAVSNGHAEWWLASSGDQVHRAGLVRNASSARQGSTESLAASHQLQGLDYSLTANLDNVYFGVVRRAVDEQIFASQQVLKSTQLSKEISALLQDNSDIQTKWNAIKVLRAPLESKYISGISALTTKVKSIQMSLGQPASYPQVRGILQALSQPLVYLQQLRANLELQDEFASMVSYSQEDFTAGVRDLRSSQLIIETARDTINGSLSPLNKELVDGAVNTLAGLAPIKVPILNLDSIFQTTLQNLTNKTTQIQTTLDNLLKVSQTKSQQVETRHVYKSLLQDQNNFCKEYHVNISWKGTPSTLYDRKIGHVFDKDGIRLKNPTTKIPSRSEERFYCTDNTATVIFVDENGNVSHILSPSATNGYVLNIPRGNAKISMGKDLDLHVGESATVHVNTNCSINILKTLEVVAEDITFRARSGNLKLQGKSVQIISEQDLDITSSKIGLHGTALVEVVTPSFITPD